MSGLFIQLPRLRIHMSGMWILDDECLYWSDLLQSTIEVPRGFITDLASIPKWVPRYIADVNGNSRAAAIVHDYLCRNWELSRRALADAIFKEAMEAAGVPWWRRALMWAAVRSMTAYIRIKRK